MAPLLIFAITTQLAAPAQPPEITLRAAPMGVPSAAADPPAPVPALARRPASRFELAPPAAPAALTRPAVARGQQIFEYSDAYSTRLTIHRIASYATIPLFVAQYIAGEKLADGDGPNWAKNVHGAGAAGLAGLFVINTVTGGLNLLEARHDPNHSGWSTAHGLLMLVADAGFAATGLTAPENEHGSSDGVGTHRTLAISSMGVALVSYLMMLGPLRRD